MYDKAIIIIRFGFSIVKLSASAFALHFDSSGFHSNLFP